MAFTAPKFKRSMTMTGIDDGNTDVPKIFKLKQEYLKNDIHTVQKSITDHVEFSLACTKFNFDNNAAYRATAQSVRDRVLEFWNDTQQCYTEKDPRRVYYLSLEFLMGRSLSNAVHNLELENPYTESLKDLGYKLEEIADEEKDAALGNGGLGRLAACFMDSLSTLNYPAWGYGIRYNFGMFEQGFHDGWQTELPDYWLTYGNPWEIQRRDIHYPVRFYGTVEVTTDPETGAKKHKWEGGELVVAEAYDTPIPGYRTHNTNNIRLWSSKPNREFDLEMFNKGDYFSAVEGKERSENITSVLYPNDSTAQGKELRLKQQYFFCAATLSDIIRRFKKIHGSNFEMLPEKVVIQLNDTHPTISIVELMRKLIDEEGLDWETSWILTRKTFCYTNHTILPEALEHWSVSLLETLLPRHMQLIYDINLTILQEVERKWPGDVGKLSKISIIAEGEQKQVRMANLAIIGSHAVNGVAAVHTFLLRTKVFPEFDELWPGKFRNITNGVTPRRWIQQANPGLTKIFIKWLKTDNWLRDLSLLNGLREHAKNPEFQAEWRSVKSFNKRRLIQYINTNCPVEGGITEDALFDVQIKRIHEYKRQLLNILGVIARYLSIKKMSDAEKKNVVKRVIIFGGKAAAAYHMAKRIIKLINSAAMVINSDKDVGNLLKVVFIPNYCVSNAEIIIPASDINQQISTAGTEASGTGNMKFTMNGSLVIGTMDGANIEIAEEIGEENMFIFGLRTADLVEKHRQRMRQRVKAYIDYRLHEVLLSIEEGMFGPPEYYHDILSYFDHDFYALIPDFPPYMEAQKAVDDLYKKPEQWTEKSILGSSGTSKFSADRTIQEYANTIWNIQPTELPRSDVRWGARKYTKGH